MFELIFAILLGLACPSPTTTTNNNDTVFTTNDGPGDTGGDIGHIPPRN